MMLHTLAGCCFFPALYIIPFYLWPSGLPRNHPRTITRRMASSGAVCLAAWVPTWLSLSPAQARHGLPALLGLRTTGLSAAIMLPLTLTALLFAGPLYMLALDWKAGVSPVSRSARGPAALRNYLVAPLTEEFMFRSCLVSFLLARGAGAAACIFASPLAFGAAHLHHLHDLVAHQGLPLRRAALAVAFQLCYTTVFGWYAAWLLLRTGSLAAPVPVHAFCNWMGFPAVGDIPRYRRPLLLAGVFVGGVVAFAVLAGRLTHPALFGWQTEGSYAGLFQTRSALKA